MRNVPWRVRHVLMPRHRVRQLRDEPYTQKEAEAAVGLSTDNGKRTLATVNTATGLAAAVENMAVQEGKA